MPAKIPALINPAMLAWVRQDAGYSLDAASSRSGFEAEKLRAWETGEAQPTLRQAERLARLYHRAYSVLCLATPPQTIPLATEYRRLPGVTPGDESPELRFALRQMLYRRKVALRLMDELLERPDQFPFRATATEATRSVARRLRDALGVTVAEQIEWQHEFHAWRVWREAAERIGVLVFQFGKVPPEEVRGVCLFEFPAPVVGINSKEIPASKPFTLIHELVHLMLANAEEERPAIAEHRSENEWKAVEGFVEEVTGAVLLPEDSLEHDELVRRQRSADRWAIPDTRRLARRYKVTPMAFMTRLLRLGWCSPSMFRRWKDEWERYLIENPPRTGGGIASQAEKALNRHGSSFARLVVEALSQERITSLEAARYLDLKYPHIEALRRELLFAGREERATV